MVTPYDPSWLVELAKAQKPDDEWLHHALAECTAYVDRSPAHLRFVEAGMHPDAEYVHSIILRIPTGAIIVDLMRDGEQRYLSGIEFDGPHRTGAEVLGPE